MKRRILSIDFDYFIDTDLATRNDKFPDGVDEKPKTQLDVEWQYFYDNFPEINNIGVIDDINLMKNVLSNLRFGKVILADSHKDIGKIFPKISDSDDLEVIHIDFHHDNYLGMSHDVDCSNWLRVLMEHRESLSSNTRVEWLKREDSETSSIAGDFPYLYTNDFVIEGEFDYIFICYSPEWTPPHLYPEFSKLCESASHLDLE